MTWIGKLTHQAHLDNAAIGVPDGGQLAAGQVGVGTHAQVLEPHLHLRQLDLHPVQPLPHCPQKPLIVLRTGAGELTNSQMSG